MTPVFGGGVTVTGVTAVVTDDVVTAAADRDGLSVVTGAGVVSAAV